jgi:hypothetical protein
MAATTRAAWIALPVVADARRAASELGGELRIAGARHRPAVDEDLRSDLLGQHLAAVRRRPGLGRPHPVLQAQERGVLHRYADAAPPVGRPLLDDVVQPRLPDLRRRQVTPVTVIRQRAQEREGPGDVVVRDDERVLALRRLDRRVAGDVAPDLAEPVLDLPVRPLLERPAEVDADDLAQHAGVDALGVIRRERGTAVRRRWGRHAGSSVMTSRLQARSGVDYSLAAPFRARGREEVGSGSGTAARSTT